MNVPLATKGVLFNKIEGIDNKGTLHGTRIKKYPQGLAEVYRKLTEAMKEEWASEDEIDRFFGKEKAREKSAQNQGNKKAVGGVNLEKDWIYEIIKL